MQARKINRRSAGQWQKIVDGYVGSGMSVIAYCAKHGISDKSYYYWKKRFAKGPAPQSNDFIEVYPASQAGQGVLRVETPGGFQVHVAEGTDGNFIKTVIRALVSK
jgi:transposase-like protein